jgi:hypothetical protein
MSGAGQTSATKTERNSSVIAGLFTKIGFRPAAYHGAQTIHDRICNRINRCAVRLAHRTRMGNHEIDRVAVEKLLLEFFSFASIDRRHKNDKYLTY